ncbi:hypothetical protein BAPKO_0592 [Borreliella afzelii PKo]|nr:hypothetical protein BAPKO_0592 [Borreliella afzelii PKo]
MEWFYFLTIVLFLKKRTIVNFLKKEFYIK